MTTPDAAPQAAAQHVARLPAHIPLSVGGKAGVLHYERTAEVTGPTAVDAADDGTFWIIDSVTRRIVHVSQRGASLGSIALPSASAISIAATGNAIYLLGVEAAMPTLYHLTVEGHVLARLPAGTNATALVREGDRVWVQAGGLLLYDAQREMLSPDPAVSALSVAACEDISENDAPRHCLEVKLGVRVVRFSVRENLQGARLVRLLADDSIMIEVALMSAEGAPDSQLWHIGSDGVLLGKARFTRDGATFVEQPLAIRADGQAYALITADHRAGLYKLSFEHDLATLVLNR